MSGAAPGAPRTSFLSESFRGAARSCLQMRPSLQPEPLHVCGDCNRPFVVPVSIVDLVDRDRAVVELHCTNCGRTVLGVHDDQALEALDRELDASMAMMRDTVELLSYVEELERVDVFADALRRDLILPEDF